MHTVELRRQAVALAEQLGYGVREEWLGGTGGGACEFGGRKWIFIDMALNAIEQLEQVRQALQDDPSLYTAELSPALQRLFEIRKAAA